MKAIVINRCGDADVFETIAMPDPAPGPGQVLIDVRATSVNPIDYKIRRGDLPGLAGDFPVVLHPDAAGTVLKTGEGVEGFAVGDRVYSFANGLLGQTGALAERIVVDARMMALMPKSLDFAQAAALPLVAITAWYCLVDVAQIGSGTTVLVQGGTGGVGHVAVQLAHALGAEVFATCGDAEKCAIAQNLGAIRAFDYTTATAEEIMAASPGGEGFDIVFNTPGTPSIDLSVACARFNGTILDILGDFPTRPGFQLKWLQFKSVFAGRSLIADVDRESYGRILTEIAKMVDSGTIRPLLDAKRFGFDDVAGAHRHAESGRPTGKVVIARM